MYGTVVQLNNCECNHDFPFTDIIGWTCKEMFYGSTAQ